MTIKEFLLTTLAVLLAGGIFASPVSAQFNGYTSPQTVYQKVFAAQTTAAVSPSVNPQAPSASCTPTNGTPCNIPNLGQSIHSVTYTITNPCTTGLSLDIRIEATNDGANWFSISEDATDQNSASIQGSSTGGITAIGSYSGFRVNLVSLSCPSGQTPAITAFYSGTSTSAPSTTGVFYQASPYRKILLQNFPTTSAAQPVTISSPTGNSGGTIYISCSTAATGAFTNCPGASVSPAAYVAFTSTSGGTSSNISTYSNTFSIPSATATNFTIALPSFSAVSLTFSFTNTGSAGVNWTVFFLFNPNANTSAVSDPCLNSGTVKSSVPINNSAFARFVTGATFKNIYVCGYSFSLVGATNPSATFENGTGSVCGTGSTNLSGAYTAPNGVPLLILSPPTPGTVITVPSGQDLCIFVIGATITGVLDFVQQ
jgi:uncharacterized protein (UPF0333 family)